MRYACLVCGKAQVIRSIARSVRYLHAMFPPGRMVVVGSVLFLSLYLSFQALADIGPLQLGVRAWVGSLTTILWMLAVRVEDDLTDIDHDRRFAAAGDPRYRLRPTVTGAITTRELKALSTAALSVSIVLNALWGGRAMLTGFVASYAITWLGFRWFYIPRLSRDPTPLAYLGRKSLTALFGVYAGAALVDQAGWHFGPWAVPLIMAPCAGVAAWEVARKIRIPSDETGYGTFSKVLGYRGATGLAVAFVLTSALCLVPVAIAVHTGRWYVFVIVIAAAIAVGKFVKFAIAPTGERSHLEPVAQAYGAVAHGGLAIALMVSHGVQVV